MLVELYVFERERERQTDSRERQRETGERGQKRRGEERRHCICEERHCIGNSALTADGTK
jgi:hypothetical protein